MTTSNDEVKKSIEQHVHEKRWDYLLAHLFLSIQNFLELSKKEHFEEQINIGLRDIKAETKLLQCRHIQESIHFINATYQGINFSLGGIFNNSSLPDGDPFNTLAIALWIQNKHVFTFLYHDRISAGLVARDYELMSVELINEHPHIDTLLLSLEKEMTRSHEKKNIELKMAAKEYPESWSEIYY